MPLYEYKCQKCGKALEAIRKFADAPLIICPHCGGELKKLFSSPAIKFKGSGFYITDYARNGKTDGKAEGKATEGKADGGKESSGETKSESKSDSAPATESKSSGSSASEE